MSCRKQLVLPLTQKAGFPPGEDEDTTITYHPSQRDPAFWLAIESVFCCEDFILNSGFFSFAYDWDFFVVPMPNQYVLLPDLKLFHVYFVTHE